MLVVRGLDRQNTNGGKTQANGIGCQSSLLAFIALLVSCYLYNLILVGVKEVVLMI
jgi:hypothetical protein